MKINKKNYKVKRIFIPREILGKYTLTYDLSCKSGDFYKCIRGGKPPIAEYFSNIYSILDRIDDSFKSRKNA